MKLKFTSVWSLFQPPNLISLHPIYFANALCSHITTSFLELEKHKAVNKSQDMNTNSHSLK